MTFQQHRLWKKYRIQKQRCDSLCEVCGLNIPATELRYFVEDSVNVHFGCVDEFLKLRREGIEAQNELKQVVDSEQVTPFSCGSKSLATGRTPA